MSSGISSESSPEFLTPLTLALLEDTGWYVANYEKSSKSPFGMGAGCDFVNEPCIVNGNIPAYSEGSFCNTSDMNEFGCDPTHRLISNCNLVDFSKSVNDGPGLEMQYFSNKVRNIIDYFAFPFGFLIIVLGGISLKGFRCKVF